MKQKTSWLAAWLLLIATTAYAEEAAKNEQPQAEPATRTWLELQRSGDAASMQPQPLSGPAMARAYVRYLKGFEHPQPMYYKHDESISSK
jgi:hypothetical protein